jgi:hypothetical protein
MFPVIELNTFTYKRATTHHQSTHQRRSSTIGAAAALRTHEYHNVYLHLVSRWFLAIIPFYKRLSPALKGTTGLTAQSGDVDFRTVDACSSNRPRELFVSEVCRVAEYSLVRPQLQPHVHGQARRTIASRGERGVLLVARTASAHGRRGSTWHPEQGDCRRHAQRRHRRHIPSRASRRRSCR